jgi:hypothetical protein
MAAGEFVPLARVLQYRIKCPCFAAVDPTGSSLFFGQDQQEACHWNTRQHEARRRRSGRRATARAAEPIADFVAAGLGIVAAAGVRAAQARGCPPGPNGAPFAPYPSRKKKPGQRAGLKPRAEAEHGGAKASASYPNSLAASRLDRQRREPNRSKYCANAESIPCEAVNACELPFHAGPSGADAVFRVASVDLTTRFWEAVPKKFTKSWHESCTPACEKGLEAVRQWPTPVHRTVDAAPSRGVEAAPVLDAAASRAD